MIKTSDSQVKTLSLFRTSSFYRPLHFYDKGNLYEIANIHFFTAEGVKFSTGNGWFEIAKEDGSVEGERRWRTSLRGSDLVIQADCVRKAKVDFASKVPFYIPVARPHYKKDGRLAELYLPFSMFNWKHQEAFQVSQYDDSQTVYDLWGIEELGVGVTIKSGERRITKEEMEEKAFAELIEGMDADLRNVYLTYRAKVKERRRLEKEVEEAKKRLEDFGDVSWLDDLLKPIGGAMLKHPAMQGREVATCGPFGLAARTSLRFYKKGDGDGYTGDVFWIEFDPGDLEVGELQLVDTNVNTKEFKSGTIGEMNGLNHPLAEMPKTVDSLVRWATGGKNGNKEEVSA